MNETNSKKETNNVDNFIKKNKNNHYKSSS